MVDEFGTDIMWTGNRISNQSGSVDWIRPYQARLGREIRMSQVCWPPVMLLPTA